jgi:hypothetical protein
LYQVLCARVRRDDQESLQQAIGHGRMENPRPSRARV